jgi:hypothetical protein
MNTNLSNRTKIGRIATFLALYIWAHRDELPAATPLQIRTSPGVILVAK